MRGDICIEICQQVHDGGGRLVALWGSDARPCGFMLHVVLLNESGMVCLNVLLSAEQRGGTSQSWMENVAEYATFLWRADRQSPLALGDG